MLELGIANGENLDDMLWDFDMFKLFRIAHAKGIAQGGKYRWKSTGKAPMEKVEEIERRALCR